MAPELTMQFPFFQYFLSSSNFQNTVSNSIRMHHFFSLLSNFSQQFQRHINRFKQRQNVSFCVLALKKISAVPTLRTSFQIAPECTILSSLSSKCSQVFQLPKTIFSYSVRVQHLLPVLSTLSHHFQLPKPSFKMRKNTPFSVLSFKHFPNTKQEQLLNTVDLAMSCKPLFCSLTFIFCFWMASTVYQNSLLVRASSRMDV